MKKTTNVYILFEGYLDHNDNTHYHLFGCFDSLEKSLEEVRSRDKKANEYHFFETSNEWYFQDHGWIIFDVWKIIKIPIK